MNTITKGDLKDTLAAAADALIDARRKAEGWRHFSDDLIREQPGKLRREFRVGVAFGSFAMWAICTLLWVLL